MVNDTIYTSDLKLNGIKPTTHEKRGGDQQTTKTTTSTMTQH